MEFLKYFKGELISEYLRLTKHNILRQIPIQVHLYCVYSCLLHPIPMP